VLIIPAIDIRNGNCVRLYQGQPENETIYSSDPIEAAKQWEKRGAQMLHIVDLDGAFGGEPVNLTLIGALRKEINIPIEVGGGFRTMEAIISAFDHGADRVILGTVAIENPQLVADAVLKYEDQVTVSIDVSGQFAAIAGWKQVSAIPFSDVAKAMRELGVSELLFTDTRRDGTLNGPDIPTVRRFLQAAELPVIISGGVTTLEDIANLKELEAEGLKGAVIGKALYDKKIQLEDAIRIAGHAR
jgi:phosphoribosylformimino-5-aminoimidazole carboxamide ribotide isomerase